MILFDNYLLRHCKMSNKVSSKQQSDNENIDKVCCWLKIKEKSYVCELAQLI